MRSAYLGIVLVLGALLACKKSGVHKDPNWGSPTPEEPKATALGQDLYSASCTGELAACYKQVTAACPGGFDVIDGDAGSPPPVSPPPGVGAAGHAGSTGNAGAAGGGAPSAAPASSASEKHELIVRCRPPAQPAATDGGAAPPAAAPAPDAGSPPAPGSGWNATPTGNK
jgi:hypothetical protein